MIRLLPYQIQRLQADIVERTGGDSGLRDGALLDSAANAPFQSFGGVEPYPTIAQKAARLGFGLIKNHPFVDGNKRIGAHAMLVFLELNGVALSYAQTELADIILRTAAGDCDCDGLLDWLCAHICEMSKSIF